ncbi:MAG: hypothetical protein L3K04_05370 [Thermoplasmata archaeon]|nr:hypothetical protein [Thermoplasmata archaeon]MCI4338423.1 hypothetical protein [Thermoplasmata archaeon]MCI4341400.1 hypothetical protein [Thermoplasmata archaeon]
MKLAGWTLFWVAVIIVLVVGELAEITRLFTVPLAAAYLSPYAILFALVLITLLALVGAVFVGFYLSSRIYASRGFTPFEQEMLRMRTEVQELGRELRTLRERVRSAAEGPVPPLPDDLRRERP